MENPKRQYFYLDISWMIFIDISWKFLNKFIFKNLIFKRTKFTMR